VVSHDLKAPLRQIFQLLQTLKTRADSTGVGLAIVKKRVELDGGQNWVKSQVGAGSTFIFTLPRLREAEFDGNPSQSLADRR
jgi:signal transduction histidine kinase